MRAWLVMFALVACGEDGATSSGAGGAGGSPGTGGAPSGGRPANVVVCAAPSAADHPAVQAFLAALGSGDREARPAVIDGLKQATLDSPDEEQFHLSLGLAYLWRLAEPREAEVADIGGQAVAGLGARAALERAYQICPTDHRIPAWLGPVLINMGRATQNADMVAEGEAVLAKGMVEYPTFVAFSQLLVNADAALASPELLAGLEAMETAVIECAKVPDSAACTNTGGSYHNVQGTMLYLVDAHSRLGNRDKAAGYLALARDDAGWSSWNFQGEVETREAELDVRIAALTDPDPGNDPEVVWNTTRQCVVCHQD